MSLGLVVSYGNQRKKMSESQYVADLAGMFERRRIALGDVHVCEQFEILLTTSDSFRSQLFTLCTAISHMSESDLSGEELLDLIARALGTETGEGAALPETLKKSFLSGLHNWSNRPLPAEVGWPGRKKPIASIAELPTSIPAHADAPVRSESSLNNPPRPAGVRTLQEALDLARSRSGDGPLRPEPDPSSDTDIPVAPYIITSAPQPSAIDNSAAID